MVCHLPSRADAQKLTIQGDRFAVDGTPRFLTFISYFGAMGAPNVIQDLHLLRTLGFDGVRIWPNLENAGPQLMRADGSLIPESLTRLQFILDQARHERLIVDVTFTHEHIPGMTATTALTGIVATTHALRSYENLIFDIQNERNVRDRRYMSEEDVGRIFRAVKAADPARITTADNSLAEDWGPQYAADFTARLGLDVTAFHEGRGADWYTHGFYRRVVGTLKSNGRPVYLQEPNGTRDPRYKANDLADYFIQAIANAKLAGAAAWCFHTHAGTDFLNGPPFLEDRLRAYPEPEWGFVNSLVPRVILRTSNSVNYLVAQAGGGADVRADRTVSGPGSWEVFSVVNLSGGPLVSGDRIALTAPDGIHYVQAIDGGGSSLRATGQSIGPFETFIIERAGTGAIRHGESITLRAGDTSWYVAADRGGGSSVGVNATSPGEWGTFNVFFVSPHSNDIALPGPTRFRSASPPASPDRRDRFDRH